MKITVVLIALTCLLGLASAQTVGLGEGYSSTQLSFLHSPTVSTFDPDVQDYWSNYVANQDNQGLKSTSSNMDIWMNTFPLKFDSSLKIGATSFQANASGLNLTQTERNSLFLTRGIDNDFDINRDLNALKTGGSLTASGSSSSTPSKDAPGKIMSQNIMVLFNN